MRRSRRNPHLLIALYVNAALLLALVVGLLARGNVPTFLPAAYGALAPQPIAGGGSLYLMPAQFSPNSWGCYILDIDTQTLCAYRYRPTNDGADLQLVAARKVSYDRKLTNFNSGHPSPDEVKKLIDDAAQGIRGQDNAAPASANPRDKPPGAPQ
ncbi:MAG TPA: hypothetical protein VGI81_20130 [Tepidisphaeraceae bacterium]|jgi:hypothetical protein